MKVVSALGTAGNAERGSPVHLLAFWGGRRKLENPEETYANTRKLHRSSEQMSAGSRYEPATLPTKPQCCPNNFMDKY